MQQAEVGRISETQPSELPAVEPLDGVVLLGLHVRDFAAPAARHPDSKVQVSIGNDTVQHGRAVNALSACNSSSVELTPEAARKPLQGSGHAWAPPVAAGSSGVADSNCRV